MGKRKASISDQLNYEGLLSASAEIENHDGAPVVWEGFTMEDAKVHASLGVAQMKAKSPTEVLQELQRGNARFWAGSLIFHLSAFSLPRCCTGRHFLAF